MRRTLLLSALVLGLFAGPAWAGQDKPQGGRKEGMDQGPNLKEQLGLTDEQAQKLRPIMEDFQEKIRALREKSAGGPPTDEMREEFRKLREDRDAKVKEILTPEQFARFQEMTSRFRRGAGQPGGERQGPAPGEPPEGPSPGGRQGSTGGPQGPAAMMKERLGLTDEQADKVMAVMREFREKRQALMEKSGGQPDPSMREEFQKLRDDRDTKLKAILTADQWAKLQEMMRQMNRQPGQGEQHRGPGGSN